MKISKLFHWLYGILMLLPCFAILVKCAYVAFNKNAYESYSGTSTQYVQKTLQTNEVNSNTDLIVGNVYKFNIFNDEGDLMYDFYNECGLNFRFYYKNFLTEFDDKSVDELYTDNGTYLFNNYLHFTLNFYQTQISEYMYFGYFSNDFESYYGVETLYNTSELVDCFYIIQILDITYDSMPVIQDTFYSFFEECPQEYLQYTTYYEEVEVSTLDNVFYYAVDEVCNNELFAWASNSFLNAPLTYITNLFNMPSDSALILLMSYWFNISIIWLVFDVMIYVPLLVHRWLDKGIVE